MYNVYSIIKYGLIICGGDYDSEFKNLEKLQER